MINIFSAEPRREYRYAKLIYKNEDSIRLAYYKPARKDMAKEDSLPGVYMEGSSFVIAITKLVKINVNDKIEIYGKRYNVGSIYTIESTADNIGYIRNPINIKTYINLEG